MKLFGFKREPKSEYQLVVDVRSSSVSVAIVDIGKEIPEISFVTKSHLYEGTDSKENIDQFVSSMVGLIDKALEKAATEGLKILSEQGNDVKIKKAMVTYGSPWNKVFTKDLTIKKETEFILTEKKFMELVEKQVKIEKEKAAGQRVIENDVTHVILNGYELDDPFNKKAKELVISFYISFISEKILKATEKKINKHFSKLKIKNRTFPIILFSSIRNTLINANTFVFFDVSGEMTDFGIVEMGALTYTGSIPIGKNHLIRKVAKSCKMEPRSAASILNTLSKGEVDESCSEKVVSVLEKEKKAWIKEINSVLDEEKITLPRKAFLLIDTDGAEVFSTTLNLPESRRNLFGTEQEVQVVVLDSEKMRKFINKREKTLKPTSHITLASIFLNSNYNN